MVRSIYVVYFVHTAAVCFIMVAHGYRAYWVNKSVLSVLPTAIPEMVWRINLVVLCLGYLSDLGMVNIGFV